MHNTEKDLTIKNSKYVDQFFSILTRYRDSFNQDSKEWRYLNNFIDEHYTHTKYTKTFNTLLKNIEQYIPRNTKTRIEEINKECTTSITGSMITSNEKEIGRINPSLTVLLHSFIICNNSLVPEKILKSNQISDGTYTMDLLSREEIFSGIPLILGERTPCCLSIGGTGQRYTMAGIFSKYTNFAVVRNKEGQIMANILVWLANDGKTIVFDTIDVTKTQKEKDKIKPEVLRALVNSFAENLIQCNQDVEQVNLGIGGQTLKNILTKDQFVLLAEYGITRENVQEQLSSKLDNNGNKETILNKIYELCGIKGGQDNTQKQSIDNNIFDVSKPDGFHPFDSHNQICLMNQKKELLLNQNNQNQSEGSEVRNRHEQKNTKQLSAISMQQDNSLQNQQLNQEQLNQENTQQSNHNNKNGFSVLNN